MSDSNMLNTEGEWSDYNANSEGDELKSNDQLRFPSCMPGVVVYTKGHNSRHKDLIGDVDEQHELTAALDVALNAVRKVRNKSALDRDGQHNPSGEAVAEGAAFANSNVIPISEMPLVVGAPLQEELSDDPAPVAPFAPLQDFELESENKSPEADHSSAALADNTHYDDLDAVSSALQDLSEIPQSFQAQTPGAHATGMLAQNSSGNYDPQRAVKTFRGVSLVAGFSAAVVAGFVGLYFYNSPSATMTNFNLRQIFEVAMQPNAGEVPSTESSTQAASNAPNSEQPMIAAVPVTSVAVRANPRLKLEQAGGESGTDIPIVIRIDPTPGGNTSVIVNGLPDGASLTAGVENTKGVWIVKPVDLETLALRAPLGLSGQYDLDVELVSADGKTMDRKTFRVSLAAALTTVPVSAVASPEPGSAVTSATAYAANNKAFLASGLSLFDFQNRAKVNGQMIARGDTFLSNGDISSARLLFERAGKDGSAVGATLAAMTYDPISLREQPSNSMRPNAGKAQIWYAKAIGLGSKEAAVRRAALDEFLASN